MSTQFPLVIKVMSHTPPQNAALTNKFQSAFREDPMPPVQSQELFCIFSDHASHIDIERMQNKQLKFTYDGSTAEEKWDDWTYAPQVVNH